jgi:UDP-N-acetylmuramoyl-tripeptide--D-alanyl-D-alanine ligase
MRLDQIADKMDGKILRGSASSIFSKFNIDTRQTTPGELFFALTAERNGHDYIPDAIEKGAGGAVVSREMKVPQNDFDLILVEDTLTALQKLSRSALHEMQIDIVGITGSIGKTTTKEFTFSLLERKYKVLRSEGNFNNHIGLPLSILKLEKDHDIAILEMGMNHQGEIALLTEIAPPDLAVITNVKPVHLEFFDSIDDIALAKKEILDGSKSDGTAVLNADDPLVQDIAKDWKGRTIQFGLSSGCDIQAKNIRRIGLKGMDLELFYRKETASVNLPFFYESYLYNFLAAAATASFFQVSLDEILARASDLKPFSMRGEFFHLKNDILLMDDSYNSNPSALEGALKDLSGLQAERKIAVLGDMLELGKKEADYHYQAGKQVEKWGWDILATIGPLALHMVEGAHSSGMRKDQIYSFKDSEEAADWIGTFLESGDLILVKGSRGMKTEIIVEKIKRKRL